MLARSDRGELPLRREPVPVPELLARVAKRYGAGGRTIEVDAHEGLLVDADAGRLEQALGNVVDNASGTDLAPCISQPRRGTDSSNCT